MPQVHLAHYFTNEFGIIRKDPQFHSRVHDHHVPELVLVVRGRGVHVTPQGNYELAAGDVFVIPKGGRHGYRDVDGFGIVNILVDLDALALPKLDLVEMPGYHALFTVEPGLRQRSLHAHGLRLSLDNMAYADRLAQQMEEETHAGRGGRFAALSLLMQLIVFLCREYSSSNDEAIEATMRLDSVLNHLNRNYAEPTSAEALAKMANMSERTFFRQFQKALGETPVQYLNRIRLEHAADLLTRSDRTIAETGLEVGLPDPSYFTRLFKRTYRLSPREYRQIAQNLRP